ncbi:hypothetical protein ACHAWF_011872 [Thalassiosira exigua]
MLRPLPPDEFLRRRFRRDAVCVQRRAGGGGEEEEEEDRGAEGGEDAGYRLTSELRRRLFDLDAKRIFAETSSECVFLWLRSPDGALGSVEIADPDAAHALHVAGSHPAYCRAPPELERDLVRSLLRATGLGGGHYHPPHEEAATVGGGTTLGRGEVELFVGAPPPLASAASSSSSSASSTAKPKEGADKSGHATGWHTDFQENFTIQLSGVKRWTLRRGRVRHPLRATAPHFSPRDPTLVENQLKAARLACLAGNASAANGTFDGAYGFEYGDDNAYGPEETVTLRPGDVLYFPAGMWHRVETVESGVSLNVSLMGTTYAQLASEALRHLMLRSHEGWREVTTACPGEDGTKRLRELMGGLGALVEDFVTRGGGARSVLPPVLCHPPLEGEVGEEEGGSSDGADNEADDDGNESIDGPLNGHNDHDDEDSDKDGNGDDGNDDDDEDDPRPLDDFEGPPGWSCARPPGSRLVHNPLASLMALSDVTGGRGRSSRRKPNGRDDGSDNTGDGRKRYYVLNVNFTGNETMESHVRVILETEDPERAEWMDRLMACEARGDDPARALNARDGGAQMDGDDAGMVVPPCLVYYGYFSWSDAT